MNRFFGFVLLVCLSIVLTAQEIPKPITNNDVVSMTKAGLKEETIVLAIRQGQANFDTSPKVLVELKEMGVSDSVLDAMLESSKGSARSAPIAAATPGSPQALELINKALDAFGARQTLSSIRATRTFSTSTATGQAGVKTSEVQRTVVYPSSIYIEHHASGVTSKLVITPEFSYMSTDKITQEVPSAILEDYRSGVEFDPAYIAQHLSDFTVSLEGQETLDGETLDVLRLKNGLGNEVLWSIDKAGKVRRLVAKPSTGELSAEFSNFQTVSGLTLPFTRRYVEGPKTTMSVISKLEVNPELDAGIFVPPSRPVDAALTIRVIEEKSVPYVQKLGGGVSTNCAITGNANTSISANTIRNYTYGNANTTSQLHMSCGTQDTTVNWQHVLNVMLTEGSDGNAYLIACDRAWRWSKCVPLRAGDTFNARHTSKGLAVEGRNAKGQESEPTYTVLESKSLR